MSANDPTSGGSSPAEPVVVEGRTGFSPIWLIPLVALIVGAVVAYRAVEERGPQVVILFESAEGLVAGKSKVKYLGVEIGTIDKRTISARWCRTPSAISTIWSRWQPAT